MTVKMIIMTSAAWQWTLKSVDFTIHSYTLAASVKKNPFQCTMFACFGYKTLIKMHSSRHILFPGYIFLFFRLILVSQVNKWAKKIKLQKQNKKGKNDKKKNKKFYLFIELTTLLRFCIVSSIGHAILQIMYRYCM